MAAVVYYLTNNEFKDVGIFRIDLNVRASEEARLCNLDRVLLDKYEASPGERIQIKTYYRTFKEESLVEEVSIQTPQPSRRVGILHRRRRRGRRCSRSSGASTGRRTSSRGT